MKALKLAAALALFAGFGYPALGADHATKDEAIAMVKKAVDYVKKVGAEKAYADFSRKDGGFVDRDLYIFVQKMNGVTVANGANPKLIGRDMSDVQDVDGKYLFKERYELASKQPSFWQDYKFANPTTKKIEPKQAYCEKLNDALICSGVYKQ